MDAKYTVVAFKTFVRIFNSHRLPQSMEDCKQLKVCPWDQEAQLIDGQMAIYYINEALVHHPMVVFPFEEDSTQIPLPCTDLELAEIIEDENYISKIKNIIQIEKTVGYLSFQKFEEKNYLDFISFGLPLLSLELIAKVCDRMNKIPVSFLFICFIKHICTLLFVYKDKPVEI